MLDSQAFATALLDASRLPPSGIKTWNGSDPARRFNVYRNNVFASLSKALSTTFPVVRALVGEEFFNAMARNYVAQSPPDSRVLGEYGRDFPDFIAAFPPAATLPYLSDVSRLEFLRVESGHAADSVVIDGKAFQPLLEQPARLLRLRVQLQAACRLLRSTHATFSIWAAHQGLLAIESVQLDQPEDCLVFRAGHEVLVLSLPPGGALFLDSLANRSTLAEAAGTAGVQAGFDLASNLNILIANQLVVQLIE